MLLTVKLGMMSYVTKSGMILHRPLSAQCPTDYRLTPLMVSDGFVLP